MVLLGDHVFKSLHPYLSCSAQVVNAYSHVNGAITSVGICTESELAANGILKCVVNERSHLPNGEGKLLDIQDTYEKPSLQLAVNFRSDDVIGGYDGAPRYLCNFGIDILTPSIFSILEKKHKHQHLGSELQLREAMNELLRTEGMHGLLVNGRRFDFGIPEEYVKTVQQLSNNISKDKQQRRYSIHADDDRVLDIQEDDVATFFLELQKNELLRNFFEADSDVFISRAPARLDVMGGIADYSGSLVLQLPLSEATIVALQRQKSAKGIPPMLHIRRLLNNGNTNKFVSINLPMSDLRDLRSYEDAQVHFKTKFASAPWLCYVAGVLYTLNREVKDVLLEDGLQILISSTIPENKGVSSSAAIEAAVLQACVGAFHLQIDDKLRAILCQMTENKVVGAACGIMDQVASFYGRKNHLVSLLCQPCENIHHVAIPSEICFWGLDSGVPRATAGVQYPIKSKN